MSVCAILFSSVHSGEEEEEENERVVLLDNYGTTPEVCTALSYASRTVRFGSNLLVNMKRVGNHRLFFSPQHAECVAV